MSSKETAVCIECGTDVPMLYKSYDSAIIKLEQCVSTRFFLKYYF